VAFYKALMVTVVNILYTCAKKQQKTHREHPVDNLAKPSTKQKGLGGEVYPKKWTRKCLLFVFERQME